MVDAKNRTKKKNFPTKTNIPRKIKKKFQLYCGTFWKNLFSGGGGFCASTGPGASLIASRSLRSFPHLSFFLWDQGNFRLSVCPTDPSYRPSICSMIKMTCKDLSTRSQDIPRTHIIHTLYARARVCVYL